MAEEEETKKKVTPKKEKPKKNKPVRAPQKKAAVKNKGTKKAILSPMVHIDEFIDVADGIYDMNPMQRAGFKAYMTGKQYLSDLEAFVPYLDRYLDK